jgi:hypothetical protein
VLSRVFDALRARDWFDTSRPFDKSIHMTQANVMWMLLWRDGEPVLHVKFSHRLALETEAARYAAASASYPGRLARLLGYARHDGIDIIVCEALSYRTLDPRAMFAGRLHGDVRQGLIEYFGAMSSARSIDDAANIRNRALFATLREHFDGSANATHARRFLGEALEPVLSELPAAPQHGDFALNNLGLARTGLVLFDWEDYGVFELAGLDLFTLLLSIAWANGGDLTETLRPAHPLHSFISSACTAMGLTRAQFDALLPVYALAFRYLKRNYGAAVRDHVDNLIERLDVPRGAA